MIRFWKKHWITIISLAMTVAFGVFGIFDYYSGNDNATSEDVAQSEQRMTSQFQEFQDHVDNLFGIDPSKAANAYKTGLTLYNEGKFSEAVKKFEEAVQEQEKISGADSIELGDVYCMLGLSRAYSGNIITEDGDDAIATLNSARTIFEQNNDTFNTAKCYTFLGIAYFETGYERLNSAYQYANKSKLLLKEYCLENADQDIDSEEAFYDNSNLYDDEKLYRMCKACWLTVQNQLLYGKTFYRLDDMEMAILNFNNCLKAEALLTKMIYALCCMNESGEITNDEILGYLEDYSVDGIKTSLVDEKIYKIDTDPEDKKQYIKKIHFDKTEMAVVYKSSDIATILTDRAMAEIFLNQRALAEEDCRNANAIWESLDYYERSNWPYTCIYLSMAIPENVNGSIDAERIPPKQRDEILELSETAVTYEKDVYGDSPRLGYFLESLGDAYMIQEDYDAALESYKESYELDLKYGNEEDAKAVKETMRTVYDSINENDKDFEEWLKER